jgi:hypothetical protein
MRFLGSEGEPGPGRGPGGRGAATAARGFKAQRLGHSK